jgi:hypothetical protein
MCLAPKATRAFLVDHPASSMIMYISSERTALSQGSTHDLSDMWWTHSKVGGASKFHGKQDLQTRGYQLG